MSHTIIALRYRPDLRDPAAAWFHQKWGIPQQAYLDSMNACLAGARVPQWYLALEGEQILGGCGVIENDFHNRPDLAPNLCALYVEEPYRCRGIAGELLNTACLDMAEAGIRTLYLLTDREGFYERYGWRYCCPVQGDGEETPSRMYVHRQPLVLYGAAPTLPQMRRAFQMKRPSRWLWGAVWTVSVILGLAAMEIAAYSGTGMQGMIWIGLLTALGLGIFGSIRAASRRWKAEEQEWLCSQAALTGGTVTRVYPDRVEQRTSRWGETVPLDGDARLTEYPDLLVLERGEQRILLRGEDLTPAQGEEATALMRAALPPEEQYRVGRFAGSRSTPAPPPFKTDPPLCFEQAPALLLPPAADRVGMGAAATAACLTCAALLTAAYRITEWFPLDFLIFFAAAAAGGAAFLWLFSRLLRKRTARPVTLAFTGEGLGVTAGGAHRFVGPAHVAASRTENGARLSTPAGEFTLRWTDVKNRQQLEWMLFR